MNEIRILGLLIIDRIKEAGRTQHVLSKYGNIIKTRLGSHELSEDVNSRKGIVILELVGNADEFDQLENELNEIGGIEVKNIKFNY
ncbi:hypothetical protein ACFLRZ_00655 [Bacteroidota bacterium]